MKKLIALLLVLVTIQKINSQHSEYIIEHCVNKSTFQPLEGLICSNDTKTKWIVISPTYLNNTNNPIADGFSVVKYNIGKSNTNDKLIIKFIDNTSITLSINKSKQSQNKDNMVMYYTLDVMDVYTLKNKPISIIRYVSGVKGNSFAYHVKIKEKIYIANALTNYSVKRVNCAKTN
jgi:hypothetical protein